jgi:hypothetical protein
MGKGSVQIYALRDSSWKTRLRSVNRNVLLGLPNRLPDIVLLDALGIHRLLATTRCVIIAALTLLIIYMLITQLIFVYCPAPHHKITSQTL